MTRIQARAKINLTLKITALNNGFHILDSFVTTVDLCDLLILKKRKDGQIGVTMYGMDEAVPLEKNNAYKAAKLFCEAYGVQGVQVDVYKNIPVGAGLGGSSADAAGVLVGMSKLYKVGAVEELRTLGEKIGSDVPYMIEGGFCRMQGRGEKILPLEGMGHKLYFLLLCPSTGVSAGACYAKYDEQHPDLCFFPKNADDEETEKCIEAYRQGDWESMGRYATNDLFEPAKAINADVGQAYEELKKLSPPILSMTGSGSAVFAAFDSREMRDWAKSRYKGDYRTVCTETWIGR